MPSLRQTLLTSAGQLLSADASAIQLARQAESVAAVSQLEAEILSATSRAGRQAGWLVLLAVAFLVAMVVFFCLQLALDPADTRMVGVLLAGGCAFAIGLAEDKASAAAERTAQLEHLKRIAESDACQRALGYVDSGYASVLAWRDIAIAERGELYQFDVEVLRCLYYREKSCAAAVEQRERNADAYRRLHGVAAPILDDLNTSLHA